MIATLLTAVLFAFQDAGGALVDDPVASIHNVIFVLAGLTPKFVDFTTGILRLDPDDNDDKRAVASIYVALLVIAEIIWDVADGEMLAETLGTAVALYFVLRAVPEGGHSTFKGISSVANRRNRSDALLVARDEAPGIDSSESIRDSLNPEEEDSLLFNSPDLESDRT